MNRSRWQQLAEERLLDATALSTSQRWAAAYYLAGYSVECGLKSCILHHLEKTGVLFQDRQYLKELGDCWTHEPAKLVRLAGLTEELGQACKSNLTLLGYWGVVKDWKETCRYETKAEIDAKTLWKPLPTNRMGFFDGYGHTGS